MTRRDLSLIEAKAALTDLMREMGSKAEYYASLNHHSGPILSLQLYPRGILGKVTIYAKGDTWRELLADGAERWVEHRDLHSSNIVREMALKIIAITADRGECTDAALRAEFDSADVLRYAESAVEAANTMASNGPFSIVHMSGANDQAEAA